MSGRLAILAALHEEVRDILRSADWQKDTTSPRAPVYERRIGDAETALGVSGMGRTAAESAARHILDSRSPDALLSLGFAGGLAAGQRPGDLLIAHTLLPVHNTSDSVHKPHPEPLDSNPCLTDLAASVLVSLGLRHNTGVCVTSPQVIASALAKRSLSISTGALAVEQESFWIGAVCRERDVPFLAVRSIVDVVERPLPAFATRLSSDGRHESRWRYALPVMLRPWSLPELMRLARTASEARNSLTAFALGFMDAWAREGISLTSR